MTIVDKIRDATRYNRWRDKDERDIGIITTLVIHRFTLKYKAGGKIPDHQLSIGDIAYFFKDRKYGTAGLFPYHFVISPGGTVWQCLPLSVIGLAAGQRLNKYGVQIAVVGDFRFKPPTVQQSVALTDLSQDLVRFTGANIVGHTEDPGGSADSSKICPGPHLVVPGLRRNVKQRLEQEAQDRITEQGGIL